MDTNTYILERLSIIRNKGNCYYTLPKAWKALREVKGLIKSSEEAQINIALSHVATEGAEELNEVVADIKIKYPRLK